MGCFFCCIEDDDDDQPKDDTYKTAKLVSRYASEDQRARQVKEDKEIALAKEESLKEIQKMRLEKSKEKGKRKQEDEQLPKTHKETFKDEGQRMKSKDDVKEALNPPPPPSICDGGNSVTEGGKSVNSQALCCQICHGPFAKNEIAEKEKYHKHCYKEHRNPYCYVCKGKFPLTEEGRKYNEHPFWKQKYCPGHDNDGTPKCCSCERLEPKGTNYVMLEDGRWLCLNCMESAYMAWDECQHLQFEIRDYFYGLNMKIAKEFPFLLVEQQALNKAEKEEKIKQNQRNKTVTRGICLSEEQSVDSVTKKPIKGANNKLIGMATTPERVCRECEVTGILILYGLPRLLTGYILAHEMMHAYLRLNGHRNLNKVLEEGLCQVLGHMWLESQRYATAADATVDASSASSSSRTPAASASKKGANSDFETELVDFYKDQIETDKTEFYGRGFRIVNEMVTNSSLPETLKAIIGSRKTIPDSEL